MAITTNPASLVARLNAAGPNTLPDALRAIGIGTILRQQRTALRRQNPFATGTANPYNLTTLNVLVLPDDAKASNIHRCYARAQDASQSTGTLGELTVATPFATPTASQVAVTPSGDIAFLATSAWNDVDLDYDVIKQDVVEFTAPVVPGTGILTIPAAFAGAAAPGAGKGPGALTCLEIEALTGTVTGKFIVLAPGATPGTTKQANLSVNKMQVLFKVSDAVSSARVKMGVASAIDVNALLEAVSPTL